MNDPDAPHSFVQGSLKGRPDLTLGGIDISDKLDNWFVDDRNFSHSDHRYIRFTLKYTPKSNTKQRYKTKNKSFKKFNEDVKKMERDMFQELQRVKNAGSLDEHVENFMKQIIEKLDRHFRKGKMSLVPTIRWYNEDLKIMRNKVSALYKRYIRNPEDQTHKGRY